MPVEEKRRTRNERNEIQMAEVTKERGERAQKATGQSQRERERHQPTTGIGNKTKQINLSTLTVCKKRQITLLRTATSVKYLYFSKLTC